VTITLKPGQERAIRQAIEAGLVRSVDEFIETAIDALPRPESGFDQEKARAAVERIREIRKGVKLDLRGMSIREFAHLGHKY
jgi:Arc/MetJ-type ribon-helix-helix transcriptional regulator